MRDRTEPAEIGASTVALAAARLRERMAATGVKPATLSVKAGLNSSVVRDINRGRSKNPGLATMARLAAAAGTDLVELVAPTHRLVTRTAMDRCASETTEAQRHVAALLSIANAPTTMLSPADRVAIDAATRWLSDAAALSSELTAAAAQAAAPVEA